MSIPDQTLQSLYDLQNRFAAAVGAALPDDCGTLLVVLEPIDAAMISYCLGGFTGALIGRLKEKAAKAPKRKAKARRR